MVEGEISQSIHACEAHSPQRQGGKEFHAPYVLARSNYVARIDPQECLACGVCKDERCPMDAIVEQDDGYRVMEKRCIGCGVCIVTCPSEAIRLTERPRQEQHEIAKDMRDWARLRTSHRWPGKD